MTNASDNLDEKFKKSCAQVEIPVAQTVRQGSCGLKPVVEQHRKSETYGVRFQSGELDIVKGKAQTAGCDTNTYIRAAALGSDYTPPMNPELHKALVALNRELTAQGRNLNQIAKHVNSGTATPSQAAAMLDAIRVPLVRALYAVKNALVPLP